MPLYEYRCEKCMERTEVVRRFSDPPLTACESCGGELRKLISSPAIQFKGSGFYITDYAKGNSGTGKSGTAGSSSDGESGKGSKGEPAGSAKSETKSESGSETKSESRSESKSKNRSESKSESGSSKGSD